MRRYAECRGRVTLPLLIGLCGALLSGCRSDPNLEDLEDILAHELEPAHMETTFKLKVGPTLLSWAKLVCNWTDEEGALHDALAEIRNVELAVYEIHGPRAIPPIGVSESVRKRLEQAGWEILVKMREAGNTRGVFYRPQGDAINNLYVIAFERDKLVLVEVEGRFDRMVAESLEGHDLDIAGLVDMR